MAKAATEGRMRWALAALAALVGFALLYSAYYLRLFEPSFPAAVPGDYGLNLSLARRTAEALAYPPHFFYPPAYVAMMLGLGALPGLTGFFLWCVALALSFLLVVLLLWRLAGTGSPVATLCGALGILAAHYGLHWDFRAYNVNLVVLALVSGALALGPRRALHAGLLLALAGAIKLYALVLLPWLLVRRDWKWLAATLLWLALLFLLPPLVAFGGEGAWQLTWDWLGRMAAAGDPATFADFPGALASPRSLLAVVLGQPIEDPALGWPSILWALGGLALGLWCAWRLSRAFPEGALGRLLSGSALALLPLAVSPITQPHHAAALLPLTLWLAMRLPGLPTTARAGFAALLIFLAVLPYSGALWPEGLFRPGVTQASLLLVWLAAGLAAGSAARPGGVVRSPPADQ